MDCSTLPSRDHTWRMLEPAPPPTRTSNTGNRARRRSEAATHGLDRAGREGETASTGSGSAGTSWLRVGGSFDRWSCSRLGLRFFHRRGFLDGLLLVLPGEIGFGARRHPLLPSARVSTSRDPQRYAGRYILPAMKLRRFRGLRTPASPLSKTFCAILTAAS